MIALSIMIVLTLIVTLGLPIAAGFWLKRKLNVSWRIITYGAMAYFVAQSLLTLLLSGVNALFGQAELTLSENPLLMIVLSVVLAAVLGVIVRWLGMKYLKNEALDRLAPAIGVGLGYGGVETIILVGVPMLTTFVTMMSNLNLDPLTSNLDPGIIAQLQELWQTPWYVPLAASFERLSALVMHLTVTVLILQVFLRRQWYFLLAAIAVEWVSNGMILLFSEMGLGYGWLIALSIVMLAGNGYLLYRLKAHQVEPIEESAPA